MFDQCKRFEQCTLCSIDKLYTQVSNVFRLCLRIKPFSALFWTLGIALAHILKQLTQPAGLVSLNSGTGTVLYSVRQGSVRFNLTEDEQASCLFRSLSIINLCCAGSLNVVPQSATHIQIKVIKLSLFCMEISCSLLPIVIYSTT